MWAGEAGELVGCLARKWWALGSGWRTALDAESVGPVGISVVFTECAVK